MDNAIPSWGKRLGAMIAATTLSLSLTVGVSPAFGEEAKSTEGYVTASNSPASQAAPEILGLTNVDELQIASPSLTDQVKSLKYIFMGTDEYNVNPNPYFYNTVYGTDGTGVVFNTDHRRSNGDKKVSNPVRALAEYKTGDDTDDAVWRMLPDVIIGNQIDTAGTLVTYLEAPYAPAVESDLGLASGTYKPTAVTYTLQSMSQIVDKTYGIAEAGEQVASASNGTKELRYGSAVDIAENYEKYVKGSQGYILKRLAENPSAKKTVAVVQSYEDGQFTLLKTPSSWSTSSRFLEITTLVANNYADSLEGESSATVTREQLEQANVDLIVLMTNASQAEMGNLATKTYWAASNDNGAIYKVDANSIEIGTNFGRILGCLYPEYLDQSDMVAYYYDTFYHIKADKLADAIDFGMDGVRNWDVQEGTGDALLEWSASTAADYNRAATQAKLDAGMAYLEGLGEEADQLVQPTTYLEDVKVGLETAQEGGLAVISPIADQISTGSAIEPVVEVTYDGQTLVLGTDYTVTYANNVAAGDATVTVTGIGAFEGTMTTAFTIVDSAPSAIAATRLMGDSDAYQTAIAISKQTFEDGSSPYVLIARDDDFADAMSATGLAGALSAPILMADRETGLATETLAEITRLGATKVYIVGGTGALTGDIEGQLPAGVTSERINGETAADTSVVAAAKLAEVNAADGVTGAYAVVAMSDNFQDALSMSSFAYAHRAPIVLETSGATAADRALTTEAEALFADGGAYDGVQVFVAGGTGALSNESLACFDDETVERLFGTTGYDTSNQIATTLTAKGLLSASTVAVACGAEAANGSDALAGAALAGKAGGVMLLVNDNIAMENSNTVTLTGVDSQDTAAFLTANASSVEKAYILGGTFVVPSTLETQVNSIINGTAK